MRLHISKKRILSFVCGVFALSLAVGTWAYYNSASAIENKMQTNQYGDRLFEEFTPKDDWQPGQTVPKVVTVTNTGDYDIFVCIGMVETWSLWHGINHTIMGISSYHPGFQTATKEHADQDDPLDGLADFADNSVVYKEFLNIGTGPKQWTFNDMYGFWFYNSALKPGESTSPLLNSITLSGDTDMGKYDTLTYYTKAELQPPMDDIGNDDQTQWVVYSGAMPDGTKHVRSATGLYLGGYLLGGYAEGEYTLTIESYTLQATQEALDGTPFWFKPHYFDKYGYSIGIGSGP